MFVSSFHLFIGMQYKNVTGWSGNVMTRKGFAEVQLHSVDIVNQDKYNISVGSIVNHNKGATVSVSPSFIQMDRIIFTENATEVSFNPEFDICIGSNIKQKTWEYFL